MEAVAKLKNVPTSPRKMRLVADLIRGKKVTKALNILKFEPNHNAAKLEKLLLSAISNWQNKFEDVKLEEADLFVKEIQVDGGSLKDSGRHPRGEHIELENVLIMLQWWLLAPMFMMRLKKKPILKKNSQEWDKK